MPLTDRERVDLEALSSGQLSDAMEALNLPRSVTDIGRHAARRLRNTAAMLAAAGLDSESDYATDIAVELELRFGPPDEDHTA